MNRNILKKITVFTTIFTMLVNMFSYASNNPFEGEVDSPKDEASMNHSESTIYSSNPYKEFSPLNPVPAGTNIDEYNSVNNYNINLKTLETRIKYFSPSYTNIKQSALSSYWMAFYVRGGSSDLVFGYKDYTQEILEIADSYYKSMNDYKALRNKLDKNDAQYSEKYNKLSSEIYMMDKMHEGAYQKYIEANKSINSVKAMLGTSKSLYNIGNVDNNNSVAFARRAVTKGLTSVVLTYHQLSSYVDILDKQTKLYYDMYQVALKNMTLGIKTSIEVKEALDKYENTKNLMKSTKTTLKNLKEQICINLGYNISDMNKLVFEDPQVDMEYYNSINIEVDKEKAYNSNSAYKSISLSEKDKKLPQSTGEELLHKRQQYVSEKVTNELENIYENLVANKISYDASLYLQEIVDINKEANLRKKQNNLVSDLEYYGLELQNLSNALTVDVAKYNLINSINEYYYATMGHLTIT